MAKRADVEFDLGEEWGYDIQCMQADGRTPLALPPGSKVVLRLATRERLVLEVESENVTDADAGEASIVVLRDAQADMFPWGYEYTVRAVLPDGAVSDQAYGVWRARGTPFSRFSS